MLRGLVAADALHCNAVLDVFQQSFQWQKALEMLNTMKVIGVPPDTASLNTVMSACVKVSQGSSALELLYEMPGLQLAPDTVSLNLAMSAVNAWPDALTLLNYMSLAKVPRNAVSFGTALDALGEEWPWALQLLSEAQREDMAMPTEIHVSQAMLCCDAAGRWDVALELLRVHPESELCRRTAMACCNHQDLFRQSQRLFRSTTATEVLTFNTGMVAFSKQSLWEETLQLLWLMESKSLQPNAASRDIALAAISQVSGLWRLALQCCDFSSQRQFCLAMAACGASLQEEMALKVLRSMVSSRLEVNCQAYNAAISACEKKGNWQAALRLLDQMVTDEIEPTEVTYSAAITSCEKADRPQLSLGLLESALQNAVPAGETCFNPAILVCSRNSFWPQALLLFEDLPKRSLPQSDISFNAVLDGLGNSDTGVKIFRRALKMGIYPKLLTKTKWLDLHDLSVGPAILAIRWWLAEVVPTLAKDPGIIVGQELHTQEWQRAQLRPAVKKLLEQLKIRCRWVHGVVRLDRRDLQPDYLKSLFPPGSVSVEATRRQRGKSEKSMRVAMCRFVLVDYGMMN
ncbi:unnamed protein product [Cladocopium goreaui]|uniref:Pentatricopeptide repeat-containing protein, chloroplastic n=1 Tax=Cladocopium goreaui TaxID=2562237 RepID=A0A9P1M547_9DINO|nr:unnamed protein product [Cladocopium goreaui]